MEEPEIQDAGANAERPAPSKARAIYLYGVVMFGGLSILYQLTLRPVVPPGLTCMPSIGRASGDRLTRRSFAASFKGGSSAG